MTAATSLLRCKLVILISGSGSNLQAFIDDAQSGALNADIVAVISNRADAFGLQRATNAGLPTEIIDHTDYENRQAFDTELRQHIDQYSPDLVILAGFMRILTDAFVQHFHGRLLNIHPSLLPKYPGLNTHQRAIDANDDEAGATVHFVTEELDGGPAIIQARVAILANDDAASLAKRILNKEHRIYPLATQWFAEGRLKLDGNNAILGNKKLSASGYLFND
ncbi:MAG: phosphoribosylglycinamide formyltransferase [Pseudomonadales bacterium]